MIQDAITTILTEIQSVLSRVNNAQCEVFIKEILNANRIVGIGAGRVGMATKGFIMRLGHLGKQAWFIGDTTVPGIGSGDVALIVSGSGETQTIYDLAVIAKNNGAKVLVVTGNPESRIGKLADVVVVVSAPSKTKKVEGICSLQPMTTLNEQSLQLFFDALTLEIMNITGETHDTMWARHSNLE